jgi:hypothetical protein
MSTYPQFLAASMSGTRLLWWGIICSIVTLLPLSGRAMTAWKGADVDVRP